MFKLKLLLLLICGLKFKKRENIELLRFLREVNKIFDWCVGNDL